LIPDENEKRTDEKDLKKNIKEGASKMAEEIKKTHIEGNGKNLVGAIILIIGLIFLLDNFFPWLKVGMDKLWPLIIVVIGAAILVGGGRSRG
jgi:membrane-bound ClpP family serine protease